MNKHNIIDFFDGFASQWDADMERDEEVITTILDNAGIQADRVVLDVACGTGVLVPDYLARGVASLTCVDISPKMIAHAKKKFSQLKNAHFICGDVAEVHFNCLFDRIVVYNAFPHFFEPENLIEKLAGDLKPGGRLTIAHGMSRDKINNHHAGTAREVSVELMHEDELEKLFEPYFTVTAKISNQRMYQVVGMKNKKAITRGPCF